MGRGLYDGKCRRIQNTNDFRLDTETLFAGIVQCRDPCSKNIPPRDRSHSQ